MARSVRVEFPGAFYHVMARGNRHNPSSTVKEDVGGFHCEDRRRIRRPLEENPLVEMLQRPNHAMERTADRCTLHF